MVLSGNEHVQFNFDNFRLNLIWRFLKYKLHNIFLVKFSYSLFKCKPTA